VVGSALIGQNFTDAKGNALPRYFQPRPSAAGNGYDATASGASNLGPSNTTLINSVAARVVAYRAFNGLGPRDAVPADAVTSSGSGLDPDISEANALDQAPRVARARRLPLPTVLALVHSHVEARPWGILGEQTVNVLDLNIALDRIG
jgi:K+-transporting ATPase ATPase C chain